MGVPLFLILSWLALQGYRSYSDFESKIKSVQGEIEAKLKKAQDSVQGLQNQEGLLIQELQSAKEVPNEIRRLNSRVDELKLIAGPSQTHSDRPGPGASISCDRSHPG